MNVKRVKLSFLLTFSFFNIINSQEQVPVELLFKDNLYSNYTLSPNGDYFVAIAEHNVGYEIVVIDLQNKYIYQNIPIGNLWVRSIDWVDSRRLVYCAKDRLYSINIDGTDNRILIDRWEDKAPEYVHNSYYIEQTDFNKYYRSNRLLNSLWDDKEHILVESSNYKGIANVYKINLFTGEKELVEDGKKSKINSWIINKKGEPILGFKFKKDKIEILKKNSKEVWEEFPLIINDSAYYITIEGKAYLKSDLFYAGVGYDNSIYLGSWVNSDKRELIEYSFDNNEVKTILKHNKFDITEPKLINKQIIFDNSQQKIIGIKYHAEKPTVEWMDDRFKILQNKLSEKYPDLFIDFIDVNYDASVLLIQVWHSTFPGRIGFVKRDSAEITSLLNLNEDIEFYNLSNTKILKIPNRNGIELLGYLNLPSNKEHEKLPLVIIPHGGPWARDYFYFEPFSQFFANRGYVTLRLNFQGSVGFGKEFLLNGIKGIHSTMIDDLYDGAKYCLKNYNLDSNRIYMFGYSYGGYASVMSAIRYPDFYNKVASASAPYDIYQWMKDQKKEKNIFAYELWETAIGNHKDDKEFVKKISPINSVEKLTIPIQIFHGEKDEIIPVEQAKEFEKVLIKENIKHDVKIIKNENHSLRDGNNLGYILNKTNEFFSDSNKDK